ncbi:hypothetical protein AVEN_171988-1 [Araneus ventricosus]|uniref:Uncharacterized protein n=1 Tax=Araneus ventricosus TaxID=182803 RepID=A0A4Y2TTN1_ARAVE|nr:hypothetical protein AVEN_171988-1 [Araneus ventricosus]
MGWPFGPSSQNRGSSSKSGFDPFHEAISSQDTDFSYEIRFCSTLALQSGQESSVNPFCALQAISVKAWIFTESSLVAPSHSSQARSFPTKSGLVAPDPLIRASDLLKSSLVAPNLFQSVRRGDRGNTEREGNDSLLFQVAQLHHI